jgi:hypothetical protein
MTLPLATPGKLPSITALAATIAANGVVGHGYCQGLRNVITIEAARQQDDISLAGGTLGPLPERRTCSSEFC